MSTVLRDIVQTDQGVTFNDIASLQSAKRLLHEAVTLPLIIPEFFTGIREPWKVRDSIVSLIYGNVMLRTSFRF